MEAPKRKKDKEQDAKSLLQGLVESHHIFNFINYRDYLGSLYQHLKDELNGYSYAKFAEDLGFSSSNVLWLVITGRRKLSPSATETVVSHLNLKHQDRRYFLAMVKHHNANKGATREKLLEDLLKIKQEVLQKDSSKDQLAYFSEWYFPVIRELVGLHEFRSDPEWICQKLYMKVMPKQVEHVLKILESLGLIVWDESLGRHVQSGGQVFPDKEVGSIAAIRFHEQMCEIARESVTRVPSNRRDLNALTVRLNEEKAQLIKNMVHELGKMIFAMEAAASEPEADLYQVNIQIFALTKKSD